MAKHFFNLSAVTLAAGIAVAGIASAHAAPVFVPAPSSVRSEVVQVQVDAKVVRRDRLHRDGRAWNKRHHHREKRREARDRDGRANLYRPKSTPKYAYDAHGNFRVHDGKKRWKDNDRWDDWDKKRKYQRHYKLNSFDYQEPSSELKEILTAVPD